MENSIYSNELYLATKLFLYEESKPFILRAKEFPDYDQFINNVLLNPDQTNRIIAWRPVRAIVHVKSQYSIDNDGLKSIHSLGDMQDYLQQQYKKGIFPQSELSHVDFEISADQEWKVSTRKRLRDYLKMIVAQPDRTTLSFEKQLNFLNTYLQSITDQYFPTEYALKEIELLDLISHHHRNHIVAAKQFKFFEVILSLWFAELISILQTDAYVDGGQTHYSADIELATIPDNNIYLRYSDVRSAFNLPTTSAKQIGTPYIDKESQLIVYKKDGTAISSDFSSAEKALKLLKTFFSLWQSDPENIGAYTSQEIGSKYKEIFGSSINHTQIGQDRSNAWAKIKDKSLLNELIEWHFDKYSEKWIFKVKQLEE